MASRANQSGESVSVSRIISRGFGAIGHNPVVILTIAFLFGALPSAALGYFSQRFQLEVAAQPGSIRDMLFLLLGTMVLAVVLITVSQGALVRAIVAAIDGARASFAESVVASLRVLLPLILLILIVWFCVAFGMVLLIVPGVILYLVWSVATPALVEERIGTFAALGRSAELTKGARWTIFGLNLLIFLFWSFVVSADSIILMIIHGGGVAGMVQMNQSGFPVSWMIVKAISATFVTAIWSALQTSLYVELRDWKDGPASRQLEDVFA